MKLQAKAGTQSAALDDSTAGEGLAIFFSQGPSDVNRWQIDVFAKLDTGAELLVGTFYISPPSLFAGAVPKGNLTRQVAAAVCPGAISWSVFATAIGIDGIASESADITLISSKCCTAPVGVSRVSERYGYNSNTGSQNFTVLPGRVITGIAAFGLGGGGSVVIGSLDSVTVPAGISVSLDPKAPIPANTIIHFTNVVWLVEYKESA